MSSSSMLVVAKAQSFLRWKMLACRQFLRLQWAQFLQVLHQLDLM
jgi:hypothetical protein